MKTDTIQLLNGVLEVPKYDFTEHDLEKHSNMPRPHSRQWYKTFTPRGDQKCPTCGAIAIVEEV